MKIARHLLAIPGKVCATSSSTTGPCESFLFRESIVTTNDFLQLEAPAGFTGGAVFPTFAPIDVISFAGLGGNTVSSDSAVAFGTIMPAPEPSSILLLGTGLLGFWLVARRRIRLA